MSKNNRRNIDDTQLEFNDAMYAQEVKGNAEAKLPKCQLGLKIAAGAQVAWILLMVFPEMPGTLMGFIFLIAFGGTIAAYVVGGGLGNAFKVTWSISKKIGWIGWFCVPFPTDIITGIMLTVFAIILIPMLFIFIPLVLVFANYNQLKKELKAAEEYLRFCQPVNHE